jgi:hypothetical protein
MRPFTILGSEEIVEATIAIINKINEKLVYQEIQRETPY